MRTFISAILFSTMALLSQSLFALGLGSPKLHSYLGEPLVLEIPILSKEELSSNDIKFNIADRKIYEQMGVDFHHIHSQFKFSMVHDDKGSTILVINTRKPIKEPFLNFIVHLSSPAGSVIKEISLLMDTKIEK